MAIGRVARAVGGRRVPWWVWLLSAKAVVIGILVVVFGMAVVGALGSSGAGARQQGTSCGPAAVNPAIVPVTGTLPTLTAEQQHNAQVIAGVALARGLGQPGVLVGIVTALTESTLINVNHGDILGPDSIGLFQQRTNWGPISVRTDPAGAAGLFYDALLKLSPPWTSQPVQMQAQHVEQSEFSDGSNYLKNLPAATAITSALLAGQPAAAATIQPAAGPTSVTIGPLAPAPVPACPAAAQPGAAATPPGLTRNPSQDPSTFGWVHNGPMEPLVFQGHQFGQVAKGTLPLWLGMLTELVPLIPGGLTNDLGCWEDRVNRNNPSVLSFHAFALACDINSGANPNGATAQSLQGRQFALPMATHDIAAKWCMDWGGDFTGTPDPMHLEIACTPTQIAAWVAANPGAA